MSAPGRGRYRAADIVSEWLEPRVWIAATTLVVGAVADGVAGTGWAMLAVLAATVLPTLVIRYGVRRGTFHDRHLKSRRQRLPVLAFTITVVGACLLLLALAGAPRAVIALTGTMLATVTMLTIITAWWKISLHCATSAGCVTILIITFGPALVAGYLLIALIAWSRIVLRDHTTAQAGAGIVAGLASALIYLALR